ncbi:hypothetical protein KY343_00675 [Candidatus Woesearchaeota archaeon]|nr:hypothetical protein [Candidatus Woesearchaeota archaeon]
MNRKKSQVEIMGLIIIVILVAVALIFVLQFMITRKAPAIKTYSQAEIAENMLTALRYTTTECNSLIISELLKKCVEEEIGFCPNGDDYCDFVETKTDYLFSQTLEKWNRPYKLSIFIPNYYNFTKSHPTLPCEGERRSATHIMSAADAIMTIRLDVCD